MGIDARNSNAHRLTFYWESFAVFFIFVFHLASGIIWVCAFFLSFSCHIFFSDIFSHFNVRAASIFSHLDHKPVSRNGISNSYRICMRSGIVLASLSSPSRVQRHIYPFFPFVPFSFFFSSNEEIFFTGFIHIQYAQSFHLPHISVHLYSMYNKWNMHKRDNGHPSSHIERQWEWNANRMKIYSFANRENKKKPNRIHEKLTFKNFLAGSVGEKVENRFWDQHEKGASAREKKNVWPNVECEKENAPSNEKKYSNDPFHVINTIIIPHISAAMVCSSLLAIIHFTCSILLWLLFFSAFIFGERKKKSRDLAETRN